MLPLWLEGGGWRRWDSRIFRDSWRRWLTRRSASATKSIDRSSPLLHPQLPTAASAAGARAYGT